MDSEERKGKSFFLFQLFKTLQPWLDLTTYFTLGGGGNAVPD